MAIPPWRYGRSLMSKWAPERFEDKRILRSSPSGRSSSNSSLLSFLAREASSATAFDDIEVDERRSSRTSYSSGGEADLMDALLLFTEGSPASSVSAASSTSAVSAASTRVIGFDVKSK